MELQLLSAMAMDEADSEEIRRLNEEIEADMKEVDELNEKLAALVATPQVPDTATKIKDAVSQIMGLQKLVTTKHKSVAQITAALIERRDAQVDALEGREDQDEDYPLPGMSEDEGEDEDEG